jgi:hypothetical protein
MHHICTTDHRLKGVREAQCVSGYERTLRDSDCVRLCESQTWQVPPGETTCAQPQRGAHLRCLRPCWVFVGSALRDLVE